jgi:thiol:disulfide interchange protein DsbA
MNRRDALKQLGSLALLASPAGFALGQPQGSFRTLDPEVPPDVAGKIEVYEFFHYGCPHCQAFEPLLSQWVTRLPADVAFMRVPVVFGERALANLARLYYTLVARRRLDLHGAIFTAVQVKHLPLDNPDVVRSWAETNKLDVPTFMDTYNSFGVTTQVQRSDRLTRSYRINSVPTIAVGGRFLTSPAMAGNSHEVSLEVADSLIKRVRRG